MPPGKVSFMRMFQIPLLLFAGELSAVLVDFTDIDLFDMKITFDLNLSPYLEIMLPKKASLLRTSSNSVSIVCGVLCQVWYLIVSISELCLLTYLLTLTDYTEIYLGVLKIAVDPNP